MVSRRGEVKTQPFRVVRVTAARLSCSDAMVSCCGQSFREDSRAVSARKMVEKIPCDGM
jgi:hypothetical protein